MSDEILLRADEARTEADAVKKAATDAIQEFESLKGRLGQLSSSFKGKTANAFDDKYNEWHEGAKQMLDGLESLGDFLTQAANAIEETDESIAGQISG